MEGSNEFHGLSLPEGTERRILYHSSFRAICTYSSSLMDLDQELQGILQTRGAIVKDDSRRNLCGKIDVVTSANKLVHMLMDTAGQSAFTQLKMWTDL